MRKLKWMWSVIALLASLGVATAQDIELPPIDGAPEPFALPSPGEMPTKPITIPEPTDPTGPSLVDPMTPSRPIPPMEPTKPEPTKPTGIGAATQPIAEPEGMEPTKPTEPTIFTSQPDDAKVMELFKDSPFATTSTPATMTPSNPTGRQEPAVSLEWLGPPTSKVGVPAPYSVVVRNVCGIAVQKVIVQVRLPQGVAVSGTEPKTDPDAGNVLMWDIGTLMPKQEKHLRMALQSSEKGDMSCQAWVTFTGSSVMKMQVREPKLLIKTTGPEKILVGDPVNYTVTLSNPGDHPAERVTLTALLSDGLQHAQGREVRYELGNLASGETRTVQVLCLAKEAGTQTCEVVTKAEGLEATDAAETEVIMPKLDVVIEKGPKLRYLDRRAIYTVSVENPGDAPAKNVVLSDVIPAGFKYVASDEGGRHDFTSRTVQWFLGEIGPGAKRTVNLEVLAVNPGEHRHTFTARASRGLEVQAEAITRVEGLSAILIEVVDIEDPIEVGADTGYEIRVTNTGSKTETDVKLVCKIPAQMKFKAAQGPVKYAVVGNDIVFEPLGELAPRADAIYRILVTAQTKGDARFAAELTSTNLVEPVRKEEARRIYAD